MTRFLFVMTLFVLFIFEGTLVQVLSPDRWGASITLVPRFVVVLLILSALFLGRIQGMVLGIIFGLLYDVVYGTVIGVYAFSMALVGYFSGLTFRIFQQSIFLIFLTVLCILASFEMIVYGIFILINFTSMEFHYFVMEKLIPTLVLNMVFTLLVAYPVRTLLVQMSGEEEK